MQNVSLQIALYSELSERGAYWLNFVSSRLRHLPVRSVETLRWKIQLLHFTFNRGTNNMAAYAKVITENRNYPKLAETSRNEPKPAENSPSHLKTS